MSGWNLRLLLGALVLLLGTAGCNRRDAAPAGQVLRISQRNEPATLDPQLATLPDEFFIIRALSEGLVTPNPDGGTPLPAMAERWETSADGLTWTYHLREAKWSNGDPVTAGDFVYSIQRALNPVALSPKAHLFSSVQGVNAPDARTLVITLKGPTPDLLALAASGSWIPTHPTAKAGNGPFVLTEWKPNQHITAGKNPHYWDAVNIKLDEIRFLAFDNGDTEERAFRAGQLDVTMAVPATKLDSYRAMIPSPLRTVALHETRYLALNTAKAPLNDVRVRRALSFTLDRRALVEKILKGGQQPAYTFIPPGLGGYKPGPVLTENAAEARHLLAEAGFSDGHGFPKLELSTWGASITVLEAIQQRWRDELGIEVALVQREARTHLAALAGGDYDLGFVAAIPDYDSPADLLARFTTGNANNYPHWSNAEFDRLVVTGNWAEAENLLLDDSPVIPLYFNAKNFLLRPGVQGWREDALWTRHYKHVSIPEN